MPNSSSDSLRLFYALWPDDATRTSLMQLQSGLHGRLIPYSNLHITLAFLGQQPASVLPLLKGILSELPASPMMLNLDRVSYFNKNRIAWSGMHEVPEELINLQRSLVSALEENSIRFDGHSNFKPHVTLARDAAPPPDMVFEPIAWRADQVVLVQSVTASEGPTYHVLDSRSLAEKTRTADERGPGASPIL